MPTKTTKKTAADKEIKTSATAAKKTSTGATRTRRSTSTKAKSTTEAAVATPAAAPAPAVVWTRVDLHMHTPGSHDYEQPDKTYLDILRQAERRGLSMIAFTDHNTINGYRSMRREIETLEMLETSQRIRPDEMSRLVEYRRLLKKIVVLPGFEFTATFGFHILGIFPPDKPLRDIEHVLMQLRVPGEVLDHGLTEAGATSDVLTAYQLIDQAGGIAIAAHANSSSGVAMRNMNLGGQTRIAFTQDAHLSAIEFTDLDKGPRRSTAFMFSGTKAEYPRRMFAIQGSDAHRVIGDPSNPKRLGVGDRATEMQLGDEVNFASLQALFKSNDFDRVRPTFERLDLPPDRSDLQSARDAGAGAGIAFHPTLQKKADRFQAIIADICGMANGEGGVIYIGCGDKTAKKTAGVADARKAIVELAEAITTIKPAIATAVTEAELDGKTLLRVQVPAGKAVPYVVGEREFFVRKGAETTAATRDEIVSLVARAIESARPAAAPQHRESRPHQQHHREPREPRELRPPQREPQREPRPPQREQQQPQREPQREPRPPQREQQQPREQQRPPQREQQPRDQQRLPQREQQQPRDPRPPQRDPQPQPRSEQQPSSNVGSLQLPRSLQGAALAGMRGRPAEPRAPETPVEPVPQGAPRTGVQVLSMEERSGAIYFTVRDLRNNLIVRNVTMKSARDLWHYAISQYADQPGGPDDIEWKGNRSVLAGGVRAGKTRYDLAMRDDKGSTYVFYGVMQEGLDEGWKSLIAQYDATQSPAEAE
jgi:hypothetical protein